MNTGRKNMTYELQSAVWEITLKCPFSCAYCGSRAGQARADELTTEDCLLVAFQLYDLGCRRVSLIGGEVFTRPDWRQIAARLSGLGIRVNIVTNGAILTPGIVSDIKYAGVESVSVSIDGPRDVHDRYRMQGSYDKAIEAVKTYCRAGIPTSVITTLHADNAGRLDELYEEIGKYPIYAWQLQACSPMGRGSDDGMKTEFDFGQVIDWVEDHLDGSSFSIGIADNIGYFTPGEGHLRGNRSGQAVFTGCRAGLTSIGIDSIGNIRGCESMYDERFIEGNLGERTLREIWEDPEAFAYNRKFGPEMLTGACAQCEQGRYCAGGCRSYNYFVHGKLYESPRCVKASETGGKTV